jgi:hypothetical protein
MRAAVNFNSYNLAIKTGSPSYDRVLQRQRCKNLQRNKQHSALKIYFFLYLENALAYYIQHCRCSCKFRSRRFGSRFMYGRGL